MLADDFLIDANIDPVLLPPMIAPTRAALAIIDVQNDFCSPHGAAGHWGIDLSTFDVPIRNIQALIAAARAASVPLVFVRVVTRPETDTAALKALHASKGRPPEAVAICRAGTTGADYYRVKPEPGDIEIEKLLYSSFVGTDLDKRLRAIGVDTLVTVGFTTECCVDCTVRDAFHLDYRAFVVTDACAAYDESLHLGALAGLSKNCALLTDTEAVVAAWS